MKSRGSYLPLSDALRLASHPQFCKQLEKERHQPSAKLTDVTLETAGKAIRLMGKFTADPPLYGVVAYFDPDGNSDYNATSTTAVPNGDGTFTVESAALAANKGGMLRLVALHANGATTSDASMRFPYKVAKDGTPSVDTAQTKLALAPFLSALQNKDRARRTQAARGVADEAERPRRAATRTRDADASASRRNGNRRHEEPDRVQANLQQSRLSRADVRLHPGDGRLLEAGGEIYATGIYAHAPARHEYDLGGKWQKLRGRVAMAAGNDGSVQFELRGDGKELWKSKVIKAEQSVTFDVDVKDVKKLELTRRSDGRRQPRGLGIVARAGVSAVRRETGSTSKDPVWLPPPCGRVGEGVLYCPDSNCMHGAFLHGMPLEA